MNRNPVHRRLLDFNNERSASHRFRRRRFERFLEALQVKKAESILDVGGSAQSWEGTGFEPDVTILNLELPQHPSEPFRWVQGDGCDLERFADQSFDIVFSNSLIEHVGDFERQMKLAEEIRRVGRKHWIQTPNKHFPMEPHFLFPFAQYMPPPVRRFIARKWPFSYIRMFKLDPDYQASHIWLLNRKQMAVLFPSSSILQERFLGLCKSLIAVQP
jgi:hypothetical protein